MSNDQINGRTDIQQKHITSFDFQIDTNQFQLK